MKISFTVPGMARGQGRPKFTRFGKHGRAYKEKKDITRENWILQRYLDAVGDIDPADGAVRLHVIARYSVPRSWSKKLQAEPGPMTKKPDGDNVLKSVCDALNKVGWKDDAQIVSMHIDKEYAERDEILVEIERL